MSVCGEALRNWTTILSPKYVLAECLEKHTTEILD